MVLLPSRVRQMSMKNLERIWCHARPSGTRIRTSNRNADVGAHCAPKIFFSPILTKLGVHIVGSMAIPKIKKKIFFLFFSDFFLSWSLPAWCETNSFSCKIFLLPKKLIGASFSCFAPGGKKLVLHCKLENGGVAVLPPGGRDPQIWYAPKLPCPLVVDWATLQLCSFRGPFMTYTTFWWSFC